MDFAAPLDLLNELSREVAAREVELTVLREEVADREAEAADLRMKLQDANAKVVDATSDVNTMTAKVGTLADNRHSVLQASAIQLEGQVGVLMKRLMHHEAELGEKDQEIRVLQQAVGADQARVQEQQQELDELQLSHMEAGEKARWLAEHEGGLQRKKALNVWEGTVRAQLQQETELRALKKEQQLLQEQVERASQETVAIRGFINNAEQKCRQRVQGIQEEEKRMEDMLMEDRMCEANIRLSNEAAQEQLESELAERSGLEARLQQEAARKSERLAGAQAYNHHEAKAIRHMSELMSLTECMREITTVLQEQGAAVMKRDPVQRAVDEEVKLLRHIDHEPMEDMMPGVGRLPSPAPPPPLMPMPPPLGMQPIGLPPQHGPLPGPRPPPPRPAVVGPTGPAALSLPPPNGTPFRPGTWGLPALIAPVAIGGAEQHFGPGGGGFGMP